MSSLTNYWKVMFGEWRKSKWKDCDSLTAVLKGFVISQSYIGIEDGIFFSITAFSVLAFHDVFIYFFKILF